MLQLKKEYIKLCLLSFEGLAAITVIIICILMLVFGGFMVDLKSVVSWLSWLQWVSACRYSSNILVINEFRSVQFCSSDSCSISGLTFLEKQQLTFQSDWDMWKHLLALTLMTIFFFILALVGLCRMKQKK